LVNAITHVIEILSFLIRPLSLSIRLFANMLAGHILLYILGSAVLSLSVLVSIFPFLFIIAFLFLEIGIAFLQAYVFTILLSIYLADAYKNH
jgi:F-type H+-transporting ATPase subunit a